MNRWDLQFAPNCFRFFSSQLHWNFRSSAAPCAVLRSYFGRREWFFARKKPGMTSSCWKKLLLRVFACA